MLTAITEKGNTICLADMKNQVNLLQLRERESFFCPECKEKVILKIGTQKIPHFAHYRVTTCSRFENESSYHLLGKENLYLWLKIQGFNPRLEYYDAAIAQRTDICFSVNHQKYALEFQCSTIPEALIKKRSIFYREQHYQPIWILGGNQFKRKNAVTVTLSTIHYSCLSWKDGRSSLLYYCPVTNQFIIISNIVPITIRNAIASITIKPLSQMNYYEVVNPHIQTPFPIDSWRNELSHLKLQYPLSPKAYSDAFLRSLYQNHLHLSLLPPEIGLPIPSSLLITSPPIIWQGYLFLDVFQKLSIGEFFSIHEVVSAFAKRIRKREITVREMPLGTEDVSLAVRDYVALLGECDYLKRMDQSNYQIVRNLNIANNTIEQKQIENDFYQNYSRVMKSAFQ